VDENILFVQILEKVLVPGFACSGLKPVNFKFSGDECNWYYASVVNSGV